MNEILRIFDITENVLNNLTDEKRQELEKKLKEDKYIDLFANYILKNYDKESKKELSSILSFLKTLSNLKNDSSWQIAIRNFCYKICCHTLPAVFLKPELVKYHNYFDKIADFCMEIIYKEIPKNLSNEDKSLLTDIILREFLYLTNKDDPKYNIAIERLKELGISEKELTKYIKMKPDNKKNKSFSKRKR